MRVVSKNTKRLVAAIAAVAAAIGGNNAFAEPLTELQQSRIDQLVENQRAQVTRDSLAIWNLAEVGFKENKSSELLQDRLRKAGFKVEAGVAGMPTAFVASFKTGAGPVLGILAEYDALPGLSQDATAQRKETPGKNAAHACGHNLFGAASIGAAIALKQWLITNRIEGEVRVYGAPAEEGGSGKVYLVRDGLFKDVDIVLHWHPLDRNAVTATSSLANISGKFRFHGVSAHAAATPDRGRSALDGVQVMNTAVEFLREHIPDFTRIHYVITDGGKAPNVVPDEAEVYYYVRHRDPQIVKDVWARVVQASQGAAQATGVTTDYEITGGVYSMLINKTLVGVADRNFKKVTVPYWNPKQIAFATELSRSLPRTDKLDATVINPVKYEEGGGSGSTDVSDVSWAVPTVGFLTMSWIPGTASHSWQSAAASGSEIGTQSAVVATNLLVRIGAEMFQSPDVIAAAKAEFNQARGTNFIYTPMLGNRKPALNYRDGNANQ